jgi:hypothetical protein
LIRSSQSSLGSILYVNTHVGHSVDLFYNLSHITHDCRVIAWREQQGEPHLSIESGGNIAHHFRLEDVEAKTVVAN